MYILLYNLGIQAYCVLLQLAALWNAKARLMLKGRRKGFEVIAQGMQGLAGKVIWFHCASLGEFEQARPVMEAFRYNRPEFKLVLTFFSPSGYEVRKNYQGADAVFYLPFDTASYARRFLDLVHPALVCFVRYEFWYHYLIQLRQRQVPIVLFSALFRKDQPFFKAYGKLHRQMLEAFTHIFVQNQTSLQLLQQQKFKRVSVSGDTRYDRVLAIEQKDIPLVSTLLEPQVPVLVVGSCWQEDLDFLLPILQHFSLPLKCIIAPHEPHGPILDRLEAAWPAACVRYSQASPERVSQCRILLIDNVGMLASLYAYGDMAYVGGGFGQGIHNILEPAAFGLPVLYGPEKDQERYPEAFELEIAGGGFRLQTRQQGLELLQRLCQDPAWRKERGTLNKQFVRERAGATPLITQYLLGF
jgi:3-deoxy-D-manno-octulosonic-acid transferase